MPIRHMDQEYEAELRHLREQILLMGTRVEGMIASSIQALVEHDTPLARRTMEQDNLINRMEMDIDELCMRVLARRQPVASDLRFITTALKLVTDLERIGDLGVNICERVIELNGEPMLAPYLSLSRMAELVGGMVRGALDAFVDSDVDAARRIIEQDRTADAYYSQIFRTLLTYMMEDPRNISRALRVLSIARYLERVGDHATNLSELVVFMVKGKDIRHSGRLVEEGHGSLPHGILFLGERNAAVSQMAEALALKCFPVGVRVCSAGIQAGKGLDALAVEIMAEVGFDLSRATPKGLNDIAWGDVDTVILVAEEAGAGNFPGDVQVLKWTLPPFRQETEPERRRAMLRASRERLESELAALVKGWKA